MFCYRVSLFQFLLLGKSGESEIFLSEEKPSFSMSFITVNLQPELFDVLINFYFATS